MKSCQANQNWYLDKITKTSLMESIDQLGVDEGETKGWIAFYMSPQIIIFIKTYLQL